MIIKKIEIENFGKFSGYTLSPNSGFNLVFGQNEAGKTTLMSFIKLMFYGNSSSKGQDISKNLRKKYTPWSGAQMSGAIEFESDGQLLRLHKDFKKTSATDKTTIFNLQTGEKPDLLADKEVGEQFLNMDLGEFERSVFIEGFGGFSSEASGDSLAMRISNLSVSGNENFSQSIVSRRIGDALEELESKRKTKGLLVEEKSRFESLVCALEELNEKTKAQVSLLSEITQLKNEISQLEATLENTEAAMKKQEAKKELHRLVMLFKKLEERENLVLKIRETGFDPKKLIEFLSEAKSLYLSIPTLPANSYTEIPREDYDKGCEAKKQIESLSRDKQLLLTELAYVNERISLSDAEYSKKRRRINNITTAVLGILSCASAVAFFFNKFAGASGLVLTLLVALIYIFAKKSAKGTSSHKEEVISAYNNILEKLSVFNENLLKLPFSEIEKLIEQKLKNYTEELNAILLRYSCKSFEDFADKFAESLGIDRLQHSANTAKANFTSYVSEFITVCDFTQAEAVFKEAELLYSDYKSIKNEIELISASNGISSPDITDIRCRIDSLKNYTSTAETKNSSDTDPAEIKQLLSVKRHSLGELQSRITLPDVSESDLRCRMAESEERISQLTKRQEALTLANEVMESAISEMNKGLGSHLNRQTGEYLKMMSDGKYGDVLVSRELNVEARSTLSDGFHEWKYLSAGAIDRVYLALRLAATDIIASKHNPLPLFLDDILTQYDDESCRNTLKFLNEYYKNSGSVSQIIFFTCHRHIAEMAKEAFPELTEITL